MRGKKKIFIAIALLYLLYMVVPLIQALTGIDLWVVNILTFFAVFALYPTAFYTKLTFWFAVYAAVLACFVLLGKPLTVGIGTVEDSKKVFIEYAFFLPNIAIFSVLYYLRDPRLYRVVAFGALIFLLTSFLYLLPLLFTNNVIMRDVHTLMLEGGTVIAGIPGYTLMHAYIIILPVFLYTIKSSEFPKKAVSLAALFLYLYIILHTYITTSLIIALVIILISLLYDADRLSKSIITLILVFAAVYMLHVSGVFLRMFDILLHLFAETAVEPKIHSFKYLYEFGDEESAGGQISGRIGLQEVSWQAFSENPLIGGTSPVGGHSSFLDRLGGMGLITFVPFVMILVTQVSMMFKILENSNEKMYYGLGLFAAFTLLYQKGLFGQEGWLFLMVLLPALILAFRKAGARSIKVLQITEK